MRSQLFSAPLVLLALSSAALVLGCSDQTGGTDDSSGLAPDSRAPVALLRLGQPVGQLAATPATWLRAGTVHRLPVARTESVSVRVNDYISEEGRIALTGSVEDSADSSFMLKTEGDELFGWVVLRDQNRAFLYQGVKGAVDVTEVPVERIYPVCNMQGRHGAKPLAESADSANSAEPVLEVPSGSESWIGTYANQDLYKLQSRPGARKVLYLNIAAAMNGDTPRSFSKEEMWKGWASIAAGYSAFDVNVTTDSAVYSAAGVTNSGVADFFATNETAACAVGAFGTRIACTIYTGPNAEAEKGYGVGRTGLHELGHLMGLDHDGDGSEEYHPANQEFKWCPIMGNYYTHSGAEALNQWSKGEYSGANEREDDLAIITRNLPYVTDDVPDSAPLQLSGTTVASSVNRGQIATSTDSDKFTFSIAQSGGHATLNITRIEYYGGSMLDVDARLLNSSGTELATSNPKAARGATINLDLPIGSYTLVIKGGAEGTPSNGFSNYSSLGYYGIQGTITGAGTVGGGGMGGSGGSGGGAIGGGGGSGGRGGAGGSGLGGSSSGGRSSGGSANGGSGLGGSMTGGGGGLGGNIGAGSGGGGNAAGGSSGSGGNDAGAGNGSGGTAPGGSGGSATGGSSGGSVAQGGTTSPGGAGVNTAGSVASAGSSSSGPSSKPSVDEDEGCACTVVGGARQGRASMQLWLVGAALAVLGMRRGRQARRES